jgi:hypothetical protein
MGRDLLMIGLGALVTLLITGLWFIQEINDALIMR